jgi:hypothetical protein
LGILINPQGQLVFVGWKSIGNTMGLTGQTAKNIARKYDMPIAYVNRSPAISKLELEIWFAKLLLKERLPSSIRKYKRERALIL